MFDAVGRKGRTKKLSPYRWIAAFMIGCLLMFGVWGGAQAVTHLPSGPSVDEDDNKEIVMTIVKPPPPPPPPPPPAPAPKTQVKPRKNVISRTVEKKQIEPPKPTPVPEKDAPKPTEVPEEDDSGASAGGVPGGVPGGVIGGVVGGSGPTESTAEVEEVRFEDLKALKKVLPKFPDFAKRAGLTGGGTVEVTVGPDGKVLDARWVSGDDLFKDAILTAIRQWEFKATGATQRFTQPFVFKLK